MEQLGNYTTEQLKTLYNLLITDARKSACDALAVREAIEERCCQYRGSSRSSLGDAVRSLHQARTFANTPLDLPADQNPYRNTSVV